MSDVAQLLKQYVSVVRFPEASGFEVLELLDVRSELAQREGELTEPQQAKLEDADRVFLGHAAQFFASLSAIGDLTTMRRQAGASRSHWWWYLDQLVQPAQATAG